MIGKYCLLKSILTLIRLFTWSLLTSKVEWTPRDNWEAIVGLNSKLIITWMMDGCLCMFVYLRYFSKYNFLAVSSRSLAMFSSFLHHSSASGYTKVIRVSQTKNRRNLMALNLERNPRVGQCKTKARPTLCVQPEDVNHLKSLYRKWIIIVMFILQAHGILWRVCCCCAHQQAQVIWSIFRIIVFYCFTLWRDIDAMTLKTQIKVKSKTIIQ